MLTTQEGIALITVFGLLMVAVVFVRRRIEHSLDQFLVAGRGVSTWRGAFSIAVSWIWAPAVFICSMQAYNQGLPGIFWFTVPNIVCFFVFAPLALRVRRLLPDGYTLPDFIWVRYGGNKATHLIFLVVYFGYQLGAVVINCLAGGTLLNLLTGMDFHLAVLAMSLIALAYSLIGGLQASVITDVLQMSMILIIGIVLVPWVIIRAGGIDTLSAGMGGASGEFTSVFNPTVAYAFGIATTLGLISGPVADQMFFQRAFSVRKKDIVRVFVFGGLLFGLVPIVLSLLGFVAASPEAQARFAVDDPQMVGAVTVAYYLPKWALMLFCMMAFAGLCSTLDSAYCAMSSMGTIDVYRRYFERKTSGNHELPAARITMTLMAAVGTGIALLRPQLLWVFLIYGALASSALFPTFLSVFWPRMTAKGAFLATLLGLALGTPLSIYANVQQDTDLIVVAALLSVTIGLVVSLLTGFLSKEKAFDYSTLSRKPAAEGE